MPSTGYQFAVDLSHLLTVGRVDFPQMEYVYNKLNRDVAGTSAGDADAFGGGPATTGLSQAHQAWSDLRNRLQDALGANATNMGQTAAAIVSVVDRYAETDDAARTSLRSAWGNGPPPNAVLDHDEQLPSTLPPVVLSQ